MRFFDYKFLILLGLTLVVYFIYREVEYLRSKVDKIEAELNQKKLLGDTMCVLEQKTSDKSNEQELENKPIVTKPVLQLPKMQEPLELEDKFSQPNSSKNQLIPVPISEKEPSPNLKKTISPQPVATSKSPQKVITLDLTSQSILLPPTNSSAKSKEAGIKINKIMNKITDILQEKSDGSNDSDDEKDDDEDDTTTELSSESSKHLAIYSNDNEHYDSTQNSLMESVEANKNEVHFNYNMDIPDLKATMDDIINSLSSDKDSKQESEKKSETNSNKSSKEANPSINLEEIQKARQQELEEIIGEKEKQLSEMSQKSASSASSTSSESAVSPNKESSKQESKIEEPKKLTEQELNDKKLADIKKIAEGLKITISKKVNGQQKQKSKQELINEILKNN